MKTILCYGDSNTHGTLPMASLDDDGRLGPQARWPGVMAADLGGDYHVVEEGLPGRTTVHDDPFEGVHLNGLRIFPAILNSHRPIDGLVLMLGTNDLKARFAAPAADIALGVEKMALMAATLAHAPRVLIVAPAPVRDSGLNSSLVLVRMRSRHFTSPWRNFQAFARSIRCGKSTAHSWGGRYGHLVSAHRSHM